MKFIYDNFSKKPFKPFYNLLVPRATRKQWHYRYEEIPTQIQVAIFWQDAIKKYQNNELTHYELPILKPELVGKKIIWQYWAQGLEDLPEVVKLSFDSIDKFKSDYQVIRLTDETINDYIQFPKFVDERRKNNPAFKAVFYSDLLRNALIAIYGGVWLDATILMTGHLPAKYLGYEFFVYSRAQDSRMKHWAKDNGHCYFNWDANFKVNYLSSIIFGKPKNIITDTSLDLLLYFWKTQRKIQHYFFYQILLNELKQYGSIDFNFPIIDDAIPHLLQSVINDKLDEKKFNEILESTPIHKLSLNINMKSKTLNGSQTFYSRCQELITNV